MTWQINFSWIFAIKNHSILISDSGNEKIMWQKKTKQPQRQMTLKFSLHINERALPWRAFRWLWWLSACLTHENKYIGCRRAERFSLSQLTGRKSFNECNVWNVIHERNSDKYEKKWKTFNVNCFCLLFSLHQTSIARRRCRARVAAGQGGRSDKGELEETRRSVSVVRSESLRAWNWLIKK